MGKAAFTKDGFTKRVATINKARKDALKEVEVLHVKLQRGNTKTGPNCWTVSLLPVVDCGNCSKCKMNCYDLKADLIYPQVIADRAKNSAIHKKDPVRFWQEVNKQIEINFVRELRINVGGDLTDNDFTFVKELGEYNPNTDILFFTKNYKGINKFLDENEFTENVHPIMSVWPGMKFDNPHELPCAHLLYDDGSTTAPAFGAYYCQGNCSRCSFKGEGCWNLKKNEHVIFKVH